LKFEIESMGSVIGTYVMYVYLIKWELLVIIMKPIVEIEEQLATKA